MIAHLLPALLVAVFVAYAIAHRLTARLLGLDLGGVARGDAGGIDTFVPEVWARKLLQATRKRLVYASPAVCNRDYEGEIAEAGDTVTINSVSDPTIGTYTPGTTSIVPEQLTTAQRKLVVDQAKYFAIEVDDVDARQAAGNVLAEGMSRGGYKLADTQDQYVEALARAGVASANALGTVAAVAATPEDFYDDVLVPLSVLLDEADVPSEMRYCIIPPWCHGRLLRDDRFIRSDATGDATAASRTGMIGEAAGFTLYKSNNAPLITGDDYGVLAGHPAAITCADQVNKTEAYRPEDSFSDAVKGLHLYGAKVTRPDHIATAAVSQT